MSDDQRIPPNGPKLPKVRVTAAACPICGAPPQPRYRPFCSRRCADVDLHRWLGEVYTVPTEEPPDPDDPAFAELLRRGES